MRQAIVYAILSLIVLEIYWLPSLIAWMRHVRAIGQVIVVNGLLGWTVIGWVVALVMAFRETAPRR